jgi:hypothetical protein
VLLGLLAGCGAGRFGMPEAGGAKAEMAVVTAKHSVWETAVFIEKVDDVPVPTRALRTQQEVEVLPGAHTIEVRYVEGDSYSTENAVVAFEAQAGRRYRLRAEPARKGFWSARGKGAAAGTDGWVPWLEDEETGAVVGGRKPHDAPAAP